MPIYAAKTTPNRSIDIRSWAQTTKVSKSGGFEFFMRIRYILQHENYNSSLVRIDVIYITREAMKGRILV